jgi:histone-lysine N-methyltransferase SETMAR
MSTKMAARIDSWTTEEVRAVIRFLNAKGVSPSEIHTQLIEVYGENVTSKSNVYQWCRNFNQGRLSLVDEPRSGRPRSSTTDENIGKVDDMIRQDRRLKIRTIAAALDISKSRVHEIVHDLLGYRKVCARWVPKQLTDVHKETRMALSLTHLSRYHVEGNKFLERIITGDETWVHYDTPETKRDSMTWKHFNSPPPRKFKFIPSAKKMMATVFWDYCGVLLVDFLPRGESVNAAHYCETLDRLREAVRRKRPGLLSTGVILLHDNATPHTAEMTRNWLNQYKWDILEHPPYSPDLAPSDFHLFGRLKQHLAGQHFKTDDALKDAVLQFLSQLDGYFYWDGIIALVDRWDKCLNKFGDYVEK